MDSYFWCFRDEGLLCFDSSFFWWEPYVEAGLGGFWYVAGRKEDAFVLLGDHQRLVFFDELAFLAGEDTEEDVAEFVVVVAVEFDLHVPVSDAVDDEERLGQCFELFNELFARCRVDVFELEQHEMPLLAEFFHVDEWLECLNEAAFEETAQAFMRGGRAGFELLGQFARGDAGVAAELVQDTHVLRIEFHDFFGADIRAFWHDFSSVKQGIGKLAAVGDDEHAVFGNTMFENADDVVGEFLEMRRVPRQRANDQVVFASGAGEPAHARHAFEVFNHFIPLLAGEDFELDIQVMELVAHLLRIEERQEAFDDACVFQSLDAVPHDGF